MYEGNNPSSQVNDRDLFFNIPLIMFCGGGDSRARQTPPAPRSNECFIFLFKIFPFSYGGRSFIREQVMSCAGGPF